MNINKMKAKDFQGILRSKTFSQLERFFKSLTRESKNLNHRIACSSRLCFRLEDFLKNFFCCMEYVRNRPY